MMLTALCFNNALAEEDISGVWEGKLVVGPDAELTVQFKIKQMGDGSYSTLVNIPEQGGMKNLPATSVAYDSGKLALEVKEVSGSFEGVVTDNTIDGKWSQEGTSFPLVLRPYEEPKLSPEAIDMLLGRWQGKLQHPAADFTFVFRFEKSDTGDLAGFLDIPAQGARGIAVNEILMDKGNLTLKLNAAAAQYKATFADNRFDGKWIQSAQEIPLSLERAGEEEMAPLDISQDSYGKLSGHWNGKLTIPQASITVTMVLRFEKDEQGGIFGFRDSPDQGVSGIPIAEAKLDNGGFSFKMEGGVEYSGTLSENGMVGKWKQPGMAGELDLVLKKGRPAIKKLALSQAAMDLLSGKWQGRVDTPQATLRVVFRFERTDQGDPVGYIDSPDQGSSNIPINEAKLEEGNLELKINGLVAGYKGKLSGDSISGQMIIRGQSFDVPLERKR